MTAMNKTQQAAQVKSELSALHRAQVISERHICAKCHKHAEIELVNHMIKVRACCKDFEDELGEKIRFGN